jgi:hypothetical protein
VTDEPIEPEREWSPEKEKEGENLQREYLKLGKELLDEAKAEKEKRVRADIEAKAELSALQARIASPPTFGATYRVATYEEVVKRLEVCWADTKRIVGDAPPEVQSAVFHTLMQTRGQVEAEGPPAVAFGP